MQSDKVIFLDIDGVLVTTRSFIANRGKRLFDCTAAAMLCRVCEKGVSIVISSTWRFRADLTGKSDCPTDNQLHDNLVSAGLLSYLHDDWKTVDLHRACVDQMRGDEIDEWLSLGGFTTRDPAADFGDKLVGTSYFYRERANAYEYVMLSFYRDQFCEGVYWVYAAPRNERLKTNNTIDAVKRGGAPVSVSLFRNLPDLVNLELADDNLSHLVTTTIQSLAQSCKRK